MPNALLLAWSAHETVIRSADIEFLMGLFILHRHQSCSTRIPKKGWDVGMSAGTMIFLHWATRATETPDCSVTLSTAASQ
jgi:hypothetical protein